MIHYIVRTAFPFLLSRKSFLKEEEALDYITEIYDKSELFYLKNKVHINLDIYAAHGDGINIMTIDTQRYKKLERLLKNDKMPTVTEHMKKFVKQNIRVSDERTSL